MNQSDDKLREQVSRAWQRTASDGEPSFERTWQAAQRRYAAERRRYRRFASVAAVAAVVIVAMTMRSPTDAPYIEAAELLESTYWSAPSDVLLPNREFDIYQDMPVIFESTEPAGGALL